MIDGDQHSGGMAMTGDRDPFVGALDLGDVLREPVTGLAQRNCTHVNKASQDYGRVRSLDETPDPPRLLGVSHSCSSAPSPMWSSA